MRVGLNLLFLTPGETGGRETYARELIREMLASDPDVSFVGFASHRAAPDLRREYGDSIQIVDTRLDVANRACWAAGELAAVPAWAARQRVDVLHSLANFGPIAGPFRSVVTILDAHRHDSVVPGSVSSRRQMATDLMIRGAARRADRIVAISHAGRDEICTFIGVPASKIDVTHLGVGRSPVPGTRSVEETRAAFGLGERSVGLIVATNLPHKNLSTAIRALAEMPAESRPVFIFAGFDTDSAELRAVAEAAGVTQDVRLIGYCDDATLEDLYAAATLMVFPTLYEGFGLPVLEAMIRGVPVACSDIPVLEEVAGSCAVFFDPRSPRALAEAVSGLASDPELRLRLARDGRAHAERFTWSETAKLTLRSYEVAAAMRH